MVATTSTVPVRPGNDRHDAREVALPLRIVLSLKGVAVGVPGFFIGVAAVLLIRQTVADGGAHPWIILADFVEAAAVLFVLWFMTVSGRLMIEAAFGHGAAVAFLVRVMRVAFRVGILAGIATVVFGLLPFLLAHAKVLFWAFLVLVTLPALLLPTAIGWAPGARR